MNKIENNQYIPRTLPLAITFTVEIHRLWWKPQTVRWQWNSGVKLHYPSVFHLPINPHFYRYLYIWPPYPFSLMYPPHYLQELDMGIREAYKKGKMQPHQNLIPRISHAQSVTSQGFVFSRPNVSKEKDLSLGHAGMGSCSGLVVPSTQTPHSRPILCQIKRIPRWSLTK